MQIRRSTLIPLLTLLSVLSTNAQQQPNGAIVPFGTLPACASKCGHLFDAQGACSPPVQSTNLQCFCTDSRVSGLATGQDVCVSSPCGAADLATVAAWFQGVCSGVTAITTAGGATTPTPGSAQTSAANSGGSNSGSGSTANSTWLSTHWQWVIMLVVLIVGIAALWIGAVLLRRRYRRKREMQYEMRPPGAPWVAGQPPVSPYGVYEPGVVGNGKNKEMASVSIPEKSKKRWVVKERT